MKVNHVIYPLILFVFVLLNIALYLSIIKFYDRVKFNVKNYLHNSHHFRVDARVKGEGFKLTNALGQYDAQWYLKIAKRGYPKITKEQKEAMNLAVMGNLSYAFFPLYPSTLRVINFLISDIEKTAFLFSNLMLIVNFTSLIYVVKKTVSEKVAIKTAFLLFLFPFSIFYRSYFSEVLFLFLLIWFSYFFIKKKYIQTAIALGLLNVTRGSGVLLYLPYFYYLYKDFKSKKITLKKAAISLFLSISPISLWAVFTYLQTKDFLYFAKIRTSWMLETNFITQFVGNLNTIFSPGTQNFHFFNSSKVDNLMIFTILLLLILSYGKLRTKYWLISLCLFLSPLFFNTTMSFSRLQIVSFPIFIYLATLLKGRWFIIVSAIFAVTLFIVSLYFVNWYWVG